MLKPNFQDHVRDLVQNHNLAIFVAMETWIGRDRAKEIMDRLPFNGAICTDTIGYAGGEGFYLLWNLDSAKVSFLSKMEQEIHVSIKVRSLNLTWLFSAIYASPRLAERRILWNNLSIVAELQNLPWVMAGDFNEPLEDCDKLGGRAVSISCSLEFKECLDRCNMTDLGFSGPRYT